MTAIIRSRDFSGHGFCISAALQPLEDLVRKGPSLFTQQKALEINKWSKRWKKTPVCFIDSTMHWCLENSGEWPPDFLLLPSRSHKVIMFAEEASEHS